MPGPVEHKARTVYRPCPERPGWCHFALPHGIESNPPLASHLNTGFSATQHPPQDCQLPSWPSRHRARPSSSTSAAAHYRCHCQGELLPVTRQRQRRYRNQWRLNSHLRPINSTLPGPRQAKPQLYRRHHHHFSRPHPCRQMQHRQ